MKPNFKAGISVLLPLSLASLSYSGQVRQDAHPLYRAIPDGAYAVVAEIRAKPGMENALREVTLPLVAAVRQEPNNLVYFLHEDHATPGHFIFYEIFATKADFDAHNLTAHVQAWFARLPELADGGVKATHMQLHANTSWTPPTSIPID